MAERRRTKRRDELAEELATAETGEDRARARVALNRYDAGTMSLVRKYDPEIVRLRRQLNT
ncbi:hypothetical protein [Arthrobacter sp. 179]|uniref:hypothetical protein n=1 Tax=Arthrobacter sp. 179 TaxID=3457734 RepID=UPI0040342E4F